MLHLSQLFPELPAFLGVKVFLMLKLLACCLGVQARVGEEP